MKAERITRFIRICWAICLSISFFCAATVAKADDLQGQHSDGLGHPQGTWVSGNLQNWRELEYIPCRIKIDGGPMASKVVSVEFPHSSGGTPGIQNLTSFVPSSNVQILSGPTLTMSGEIWKYTLTVKVLNNQLATIQFFARMRAGAHRFTGSSLKLSYPPLQIHKPDAGLGVPDLTVKKLGPATAGPGELITYTIFYTNKVTAANAATGVQLTDVLPSVVTYVPGSASIGGELVGNSLIWDLPNLPVGASGSVTYQAIVNSNVVSGATFQNSVEILSAEDDLNYADNTSVVITSVAFNRAPVANADFYSVNEDAILNVGVSGILANDTDADGNALSAVLVAGPARGTLTLQANGSFTYTPSANFNGIDTFTYRANDGSNLSGIATVTITVNPVNDAPIANDDTYSVVEGGTLTRTTLNGVLSNDTDVETNVLSAILVSGPTHGTLTLNANGSLTYIHHGSETSTDSFTYKANDGLLDSGIATVSITITGINDAPVANDDSFTVVEGGTLNRNAATGVLANDTDAEGNAISAILVSNPAHGTLTLNADGSLTYIHNGSETTSDRFTYKANDGSLDSGVATVSITITPTNDAPIANNDAYTVVEGGMLNPSAAAGVLANDTDAETNALTALLVAAPIHGSLTLNANGSFTYVHNGSETTTDSFTYKANDGLLDSGIANVTISITPTNDAPVANNDSYDVIEGGTLNRTPLNGVLSNDADAESNTLSAILVSVPLHGTLTLNSDGSLIYIHDGSETTVDSFTYKANDGLLDSGIATVTITITSSNDAPVANNDAYTIVEGGTLNPSASAGVLANDRDAETNALTAILVSGPSFGSLTLNADGSFNYVHNGSETMKDSFAYKANDGFLDSGVATVNITITPTNDAPVAIHDSYTISEGQALSVAAKGVLVNDTDAEGDSLSAILASAPKNGELTLNNDGSFTYVHDGSETSSDSFTYKANDGALDSGVATVSISVLTTNDAPIANDDSYIVDEGGTLSPSVSEGVLANDTDEEGNILKALLVAAPAHGTISLNEAGTFVYKHDGSETLSDTFTYKANDGSLDSQIATVSIAITPKNNAPVANNDAYFVNEDSSLVVTNTSGVLANDADAETNLLTAILVNAPAHGTVNLQTDGSFVYHPPTNFNGAVSFTYKANDGIADSEIATANIVVRPVNDAPGFSKGSDQLVIRNSGVRTIPGWATNITPGPANELDQAATFQLSNDNANLFLQQPSISSNGTLSFAPAFNAFGKAVVSVTLKDNGGTDNGGIDTSSPQTFEIVVNSPPTVELISPTNGSTFVWGQNVTLISDAMDPDGSVTNVQFFHGTNKVGEVSAAPYFQILTNMQPGIYQFTATATDNFGLSATSSVVTITVLGSLPFTEPGAMRLNPQTGLIEQRIVVANPTPLSLSAARVLVFGLAPGLSVYNASGTNNGVPFVQYNQPILPGGSVEMLIEYYVPSRVPPTTTLVLEVVPSSPAAETTGTGHRIDKALRFSGGTFLLEFTSITNRYYSIQYSSDLKTWKTVTPSIRGNGSKIQWIDNGSPKTESLPGNSGQRFYRVILVP